MLRRLSLMLLAFSLPAWAGEGFFFYKDPPRRPAPSSSAPASANVTVVGTLDGQVASPQSNPLRGYDLKQLETRLKVGDFILRTGRQYESRVIRQVDNSPYSHVAYVTQVNPQVWVVHTATDEVPGKPYQVVKERLSAFLDSNKAEGFAVYRPDFMNIPDRELTASELERMVGQPFILASREKPHRYCSTIIRDAVRKRYPGYNPQWKQIAYKGWKGVFLTPSSMITNGMSLIEKR